MKWLTNLGWLRRLLFPEKPVPAQQDRTPESAGLEEASETVEQMADQASATAATESQPPKGTLETAYERLQGVLGNTIEPYAAVELVEQYREYWRPRDVKVILLAESHAYTSTADMELVFDAGLSRYPSEYCRFIYCLAYGEPTLTANPDHPRDGTPQYWKILYSCANEVTSNEDFALLQTKTPYEQRIKNKIDLLKQLQEMGVWLVDASVVGLAHKGRKPSRKKSEQALLVSWQTHTFDLVRKARPRHVICAGKQLSNLVSTSLHNLVGDNYTVVSPANARLSHSEQIKTLQTYGRVCAKYCV
jgi:hypothetical protein